MVQVVSGSNAPASADALAGLSGGPVVLFDGLYNSVVISPMDNFKNAVQSLSATVDTALIQLWSAARQDTGDCLGHKSRCWAANYQQYETFWVEGEAYNASQVGRITSRSVSVGINSAGRVEGEPTRDKQGGSELCPITWL